MPRAFAEPLDAGRDVRDARLEVDRRHDAGLLDGPSFSPTTWRVSAGRQLRLG
jgi:hypothetical protein